MNPTWIKVGLTAATILVGAVLYLVTNFEYRAAHAADVQELRLDWMIDLNEIDLEATEDTIEVLEKRKEKGELSESGQIRLDRKYKKLDRLQKRQDRLEEKAAALE